MPESATAIDIATAVGNATEFRFDSLQSLQDAVRELEHLYPWLKLRKVYIDGHRRRRFRSRDPDDSDDDIPAVSKLEPTASGTPQRVGGKKHKGGGHRRQQQQQTRQTVHIAPLQPSQHQPPAPAIAAFTSSSATAVAAPPTSVSSGTPATHSQLPTCGTCFKRGHTTAQHRDDYKPKCDTCGGPHPTHRHGRTRPSYAARRVRFADDTPYVATALVLSAPMVASSTVSRQCAFITSPQLAGPARTYNDLLLDSGADISCINRKLVHAHNLTITPPVGPTTLKGFGSSMATHRIGTVDLRVTVHLPLEVKSTITFDKQFEVTDMDNDFLIGRDVLPQLFPNDVALKYCNPHSPITDTPRNVDTHQSDTDDDDGDDDGDTPAPASSSASSTAQ